MPIETIGTNHFAVSVADLEASIRWYEDVLGFRLVARNTIDKLGVPVAHLDAPDSGFVLELFAPTNAKPTPDERRFPDTDMMTNGNKHFSLSIADSAKTMKKLGEMGIEIVMTADVWNTFGIFIRDPSGNVIELMEGDMRGN